MKKVLKSFLLLCITFTCTAQQEIDSAIIKQYHRIVRLILDDSVATLATLVNYPLTRENPLPDITSAKDFISYYHILIDDTFKQKLKQYTDSDIFEHVGAYGLVGGVFRGETWIHDDGMIGSINYSSAAEQKLSQKITDEIRSKMYPGIKPWKVNVVVCKSEKYLVRIDRTDNGLRYISWSNGHPTSEKPGLILYDGKEEARGSGGGWTFTFTSGKWTYVIDEVEMCDDSDNVDTACGTFLRILYDGQKKYTYRCTEIK